MKNTLPPAPIYLEDLRPGQHFVTLAHALDEKQIVDYARQFDPQPFHTDATAARRTLFGGLVASGWHTAAVTMRLIVQSLPIAGGVIGAGGEADWPQPVFPDDVLHVEGEIIEIIPSQSRPDRGIAILRAVTKNAKGEAVQNLTAKLMVFRRPTAVS